MRRPRFAHKRCFDSFPAFLSSLHQKQPSISILISNISTPDQIEEMFANRDVPAIFHTYLADPIDVTVVGQDFHVGGNYKSMQAFHEGIYARVAAALKVDTIRVEVRRVIGGGEASWAAVESLCTAESKYDKPYHSAFVDLVGFNSQGKIAQLKEFLDSGHIQNHVVEHEEKQQEK